MFVRAGLVSLGLLLLSRVLGLVRESALAAAFGTSGLGDLAVLMLSLPDWLAGLLASGALSYVLLPHWAAQDAARQAHSLRRIGHWLLLAGAALALAIAWQRASLLALLVPGLPDALQAVGAQALVWSGLAMPAALLAALWSTRLQHGRDFTGLYAASLVLNGILVLALLLVATGWLPANASTFLGWSLLGAMLARLGWLRWRLGADGPSTPVQSATGEASLPALSVWVWAGLVAGLPLALPFAARSLASQHAEGALATFNYAWKLVELPLVLAIQLVATLAFPAISRALVPGPGGPQDQAYVASAAIRSAFALAWTLACAAAAALLLAAPALAQVLYGWGRMGPDALVQVADWGRAGAWGLLPQALIAVTLTILAAKRRLQAAVWANAAALALLLACGALGASEGAALMWLLNGVLLGVALATLWALGPQRQAWLPWPGMWAPALVLLLTAALQGAGMLRIGATGVLLELVLAGLAATFVIAAGWITGPDLRRALGR